MVWIVSALSVILFFVLLWLFCICPSLRRHPHLLLFRNARIAHRGLHDDTVPENSLTAFRRAAEAGFAIENDIHITADGEIVVFHDDTLDRMCGVSGRPEEFTLAELKALRLAGRDEQIPTLAECLAVIDGRVPLLIEFKCRTGDVCARLCPAADAVLAEYKGVYWIQSFYPFVLSWYRKHRPDVCRGQLATAFVGDKLHMRMLGMLLFNVFARPDFVSYEWKYRHKWNRRICTALGAAPVGWTFRAEEEIKACKEDFAGFIFEGFLPKK
ncbi:MAG: glycerophosphodiester phosphodiesterase [Ruminococcaceae bacterium]|nr:glycerophosphodiester phosphodiesterase [Oscillospiraceae bacterium]